MENQDQIHCPKCNSTQITTNKKGFSGRNAVVGAVLTGGIGLLAGTIGRNKILITCLNCGNQFSPGDSARKPGDSTRKEDLDTKKKDLNERRQRLALLASTPKLILDNNTNTFVPNPEYVAISNDPATKQAKTSQTISRVFCPLFALVSALLLASGLIVIGVVFGFVAIVFFGLAR